MCKYLRGKTDIISICIDLETDMLSISELSVHRIELFPELDRSEFRRPRSDGQKPLDRHAVFSYVLPYLFCSIVYQFFQTEQAP